MKRIGTISSSAGLIFLGVWMILGRTNPAVGAEVFKWWPIIIIILGAEILVHFSKKVEDQRLGFNWVIVPVIIVFLTVNLFQGITNRLFKDFSFDNFIRVAEDIDIDVNNYRALEAVKTLDANGNNLTFVVDNGKITIKKSNDDKIIVDARVYVRNNSRMNKYDISEIKESDGYKIDIRNNDIKKVEADIYIPEKYNLKIEADNLNLKGDDNLAASNLDIKSDNANVDLYGISNLIMNFDNGNVKVLDAGNITMKGDNANVNIGGKSENIDLRFDNGKVDIRNELSKNVNIEMDHGVIDVDTQDNNLDVLIDLKQGVSRINEDKRVNSGISKTIGSGEGKIRIKVDQGTVGVRN